MSSLLKDIKKMLAEDAAATPNGQTLAPNAGLVPQQPADSLTNDPESAKAVSTELAGIKDKDYTSDDNVLAGEPHPDTLPEEEEVVEEEDAPHDWLAEALENVSKVKIDRAEFGSLFEGAEFTDEFKTKAIDIFEATINSRLQSSLKEAVETLDAKYKEVVMAEAEELEENIHKYASHVAEEWVKENKLAIESGMRAELAESFMEGLKNLFNEHYIDVPQSKVDVVEALHTRLGALEQKLSEGLEREVELKEQINSMRRGAIVQEALKGLSDLQADKVKKLIESVPFTSEDDFKKRVGALKENFNKPAAPKKVQSLVEDTGAPIVEKKDDDVAPEMQSYVRLLGNMKSL